MLTAETVTLNLMEDVWASLHLSPEAVIEDTGFGSMGVYIKLVDADDPAVVYYLDNGWGCLPDGTELRARYGSVQGLDVFTVTNLPGDLVSWQQKAVEPLVDALREHMSRIRATVSDNA